LASVPRSCSPFEVERGVEVPVDDQAAGVAGETFVATAGIALSNVLIPVVIKDSFSAKVGLMTDVYTAALQGGGALGSAITPPLDQVLGGWRPALGRWAVLGVASFAIWIFAARNRVSGVVAGGDPPGAGRSLLRSPLAWMVTLFFGLQAFIAYVVMGWLPQVLMDAGVSQRDAGLLLGLISVLAVPISLIVQPLTLRQGGQSGWIVGLGVFGFTGMVGLLVAPAAAPLLWSVLVFVAQVGFRCARWLPPFRVAEGNFSPAAGSGARSR
jgi:CP family cyanate transporter-like MFS transporter